ncbi:MAG TPA: HlyD family efflux transporter periplasmic adaptor subunit [Vicinamibacterales bacterium]|nr:HlyD family efflux transporter periplasmic adaptor subunit [Vicinamibacterales bacterium]
MRTRATRIVGWAAAVGGLLLAAILIGSVRPAWSRRAAPIPTARVTRGPLIVTVHARGEVLTGRLVLISAPPAGRMLQIVRLPPTGTHVKAGDVVLEFDASEQQHELEQSLSTLQEAEQEIVKLRADTDVQAAQDRVDLLTARFDVRRAELDAAAGAELVGAVEARKRQLALQEARQRLAQLEKDVESRRASSRAALAVLEEKRTKAQLAAERARQTIDSFLIRAPMDGIVIVRENRNAAGGVFFSGMVLPDLRAGDTVWPGSPVLDIMGAGSTEIRARIDESDRGNVAAGQRALVRLDAMPDQPLRARVVRLGGLAVRRGFFDEAGPSRQFDVTVQLEDPRRDVPAGMSADVVIEGGALASVLRLPRHAVFEKDGRPVVYVREGAGFTAREVTIVRRTETYAAIEGVPEGTEVALVNPERPAAPAARTAPGGPPAPAGPR